MSNLEIQSVEVHFLTAGTPFVVKMSVQETFNVLTMPSFAGLICHMVPKYGMPVVSNTENKE